jgi:hypothetical protein
MLQHEASDTLSQERGLPDDTDMFEQFDFLDSDECRRTADLVYALKPHWEARLPDAPFFTLGAASYVDAAVPSEREARYYAKAARLNPILDENFGWLYGKLMRSLEERLGGKCAFKPRAARPGFHVFLPVPLFQLPIAKIHADLQFGLLDWSEHPRPDFANPMSFTVSVVLPRGGGGLNTWDVPFESVRGLAPEEIAKKVASIPPAFRPYSPGGMVLHSGQTLHQIAPLPEILPGDARDARITLQGHAIRSDGTWWLHW